MSNEIDRRELDASRKREARLKAQLLVERLNARLLVPAFDATALRQTLAEVMDSNDE